jgi:virulence-associated protein VapD
MANTTKPVGFWPSRHLTGGDICETTYILKTGATIYKGDPVTVDSTGTVKASAAGDATAIIGIAAEYKADAASAGSIPIKIYDDPHIIFGVQLDNSGTASTQASVFLNANMITYAAGSTTTFMSAIQLSQTSIAVTSTLSWKILGLCNVRDVNNAWGHFADVEVMFNSHQLMGGTTGV